MTDEAGSAIGTAPPREESVGETLVRARAALGLSIEDCAQQLKFAPRKLEALEQGRFDALHGGTYARGMLRAYARLLHLDADALVQRVADHLQVADTTATAVSLRRPIPFSEPGKRSNVLYVALSVAALGVVAWVGYSWQQERSGAANLRFVPAAQPAAETKSAAIAATVLPVIAPQRIEPETPAPPVEALPAPAQQEKPALAPGKRRIVLRFERDSWVEIRGGTPSRLLMSQINPAGTERTVDGSPPFSLVIGNAQYVRVRYDDAPVDLAPHAKSDVARFTLD